MEEEEIETGVEEIPIDPLTPTTEDVDGNHAEVSMDELHGVPYQVRDQWGESSQLLYQNGYVQVLKQMAYSGQMQMYNIRSVAWRLFLGCLPEEHSKWEAAVTKSRDKYNQLKKKHITDPHIASASLDVAINNPLSQEQDSPWHRFFLDNELRQMINQDVVRTFPDVAFFKQTHIQETMLDLLFIYSKVNSDLGYRQGMHEVLAPIMFVLHAEERDHDDSSLAPEVQIVMDSDYLEHDAYTIFTELMDGMEQWYMSSALEVDYFRTRYQANSNRKMQHDPRTQQPFQSNETIAGSSAISRKLEKIHHVLLKRADEVLYTHLIQLSIPAQTYGIRWLRLLFGREFPLPSVLELWDALFAEGLSLGLVDYVCVAMLMHIREVLIEGDYAICMQHLMRFPIVYEVNYLVQRALHLRSPTTFPSPRIWTYHPSKVTKPRAPPEVINLLDERFSTGTGNTIKSKAQNSTDKIADFFQSKTRQSKSSTNTSKPVARLEFHKSSSSRSPSPQRKQTHDTDASQLTDEQLFSGALTPSGGNTKRTSRFKILGDRNKNAKHNNLDREMTNNPKAHPLEEASMSELERLTTRLEDQEAKGLYCGGKMDTIIATLQDEIPEIPNLNPDTENTLFLAIAGLKQIRDLLLKKITFSGDATLGWDSIDTRSLKEQADVSRNHAPQKEKDLSDHTSDPTSGDDAPIPENSLDSDCRKDVEPARERQVGVDQVVGSEDSMDSVIEDDWVNLSTSAHPLVTSND